ncbi:MAG: dephospho-CoA kinase [Spirochaetales bacterium]|nr:dephospho-CoA kinase [Candidatus Physcosoma equi]
MIIGLTGRSCSGKDKFASLLDDRFVVIDEDHLGHVALEANVGKLTEAFGSGILREDGTVDRKKLGPIVFASPEKLETLNNITHPWMVEETLRQCKAIEDEGKIAVINAAILESMGFVQYCKEVVLVLSDYQNRLKRAMLRDGMTEEAFKKRSDAQKDIGSTLFSSGKKIVTILNNGDEDSLSRQVSSYCGTIRIKRA